MKDTYPNHCTVKIQQSSKNVFYNLSFIIVAEQGKPAEEKFIKIKQMYTKLRTEHVQLLRTVGQGFIPAHSGGFSTGMKRTLVQFLEWRGEESANHCREREKGASQSQELFFIVNLAKY
jgi:hypothetical protein